MIVAMQDAATEEHIQNVIERMVELGFNVHRTTGAQQTILAGVGTPAHFDVVEFKVLAGVHDAAADLGVRQRNCQIYDYFHLGIGEQPVRCHRLHAVFLRLRGGDFGTQIGGRFHPDTIMLIARVILPVIGTTLLLLAASLVLAAVVAQLPPNATLVFEVELLRVA